VAQVELIAPQTTAANSGDQVVAAGTSLSVGLKIALTGPIPWDEVVKITRKDDNAKYADSGFWLGATQPSVEITGEGTYRVEKPVTRNAIGVYIG
jgi:hypothetical protein